MFNEPDDVITWRDVAVVAVFLLVLFAGAVTIVTVAVAITKAVGCDA